ncbi:MAG TPA: tetratricopeptide repeat protein [Pyrinomonadaceae bacterium]|nr:tetratricopeptide repeat protein [Pyrinomonadaceae bacterium]
MNSETQLPDARLVTAGTIILLEAQGGSARREVLQRWLQDAQTAGASTWFLSSDFDEGGVWAGIKQFIQDLLPSIEADAPHLIKKHGYELVNVVPALRGTIEVRHPLTETAPMDEQVRNYPIDRAFRIVHGLVDMLDEWHSISGAGRWVIACDNYDKAGAMGTRFFTELMRRRGRKLQLTLAIATAPGTGKPALDRFEAEFTKVAVSLDLPAEEPARIEREEAERLARELEARVGKDKAAIETNLPQLISYNLLAGHEKAAQKWQAIALGINNHHGFYEDALRYAKPVLKHLDNLSDDDEKIRWNLVGNLFGCYVAAGDSATAHQVVVEEGLNKIKQIEHRVKVYYVMGMLYSRYLPQPDLAKATEYLETALADIEKTNLEPADRAFITAFTMNGLAFVRHRQNRPEEAVELCRAASDLLDAHLLPDQHRLHRSVLQFNIAQVYTYTNRLPDSISFYSAAMEMDPYYSEYYNDRGSAYFKLGDLNNALADYMQAIELSPPYAEVLTNLGQCLQALDQPEKAIEAYSTSLDLMPSQSLALVGRAQAFEMTGRPAEAMADYSASLALDPKQPLVLSNRAVLHYELGDVETALADLNQAIQLSPATADLYQNRASALTDLGRLPEALSDLQTYLRLSPDAPDRDDVLSKVSELTAANSHRAAQAVTGD